MYTYRLEQLMETPSWIGWSEVATFDSLREAEKLAETMMADGVPVGDIRIWEV